MSELQTAEKRLTAEKLAEYRELVQYGNLIGVGGSALASLLDEIARLDADAANERAERESWQGIAAQRNVNLALIAEERDKVRELLSIAQDRNAEHCAEVQRLERENERMRRYLAGGTAETSGEYDEAEDMANVGRALMETLKAELPGWSWMQSPAEIVAYLLNQIHDLNQKPPETSGELLLTRNALGNLYMAVLKFGPIDRDIQFAMNEAGQLLGSPIQVKEASGGKHG
jgi:hypothetical protein